MIRDVRLHQFSPQRTDPEQLEAILVARHALIDTAVEKIRNSATTTNKHHLLFVGPRGIGKTHLLTLINYRVGQDSKIADKLRIAWLNEDETSSRFLPLLLRIYRSLSARYPAEFPAEDVQDVMGLAVDEALDRLTKSLLDRLKGRTILLLIENLDSHFSKFSVEEQRRWRGFIQDHPVFTTVATAQRLFDGVSKHDHAFFGFFETHHLQPLSVDQTQEMLQKIAAIREDTGLEKVLGTARGLARLKTIHFLAGGNPRLYVLMSELITEETLDDVVDTFETMVDRQLTSYYQERLRWLSAQQQEVVQVLCRNRHPIAVKQIAEELFTTNQSISSQLKELRDYGYVRSTKDGRETKYELAEPLMRLVMDVKETHSRQPLRLLVDFLSVWFEREELESKLAAHNPGSLGRIYLESAIRSCGDRGWLGRDGEVLSTNKMASDQLKKLWETAREHEGINRFDLAIRNYTKIIENNECPSELVARALLNRGFAFGECGKVDEVISDCTTLIEMKDAPIELVAKALINRGITYGEQSHFDHETTDYTTLMEMKDAPSAWIQRALFNRGVSYGKRNEFDKAIIDYTTLLEMEQASTNMVSQALLNRGASYGRRHDRKKEIADYATLLGMKDAPVDQIAMAFVNRGMAYWEREDWDNAIADFTRAIDTEGAPTEQIAKALVNRGWTHGQRDEPNKAIADFTKVIESHEYQSSTVFYAAIIERGVQFKIVGDTENAVGDLRLLLSLDSGRLRRDVLPGHVYRMGMCKRLVQIAFDAGPSRWGELVPRMSKKLVEIELIDAIGRALVDFLGELNGPDVNASKLRKWADVWIDNAAEHESLQVSLRLLSTGIDYIITQSLNTLLQCPLEERRILRQALGLDEG